MSQLPYQQGAPTKGGGTPNKGGGGPVEQQKEAALAEWLAGFQTEDPANPPVVVAENEAPPAEPPNPFQMRGARWGSVDGYEGARYGGPVAEGLGRLGGNTPNVPSISDSPRTGSESKNRSGATPFVEGRQTGIRYQ